MNIPGLSAKLSAAVTAGLMFFIISNPIVYRVVDNLLGGLLGPIASPSGCPTTWGLIVHSAVFATAVYYGVGL
jgi:uncharacterized membrane protein (DUF106 family)